MKKLLLGAFMLATLGVFTTSCGGDKKEVNNDSLITPALNDSLANALGAYYGADCATNFDNSVNIDEFIKGVQLVVGNDFTPSEMFGIAYALQNLAPYFEENKEYGIELSRDLFLQQFRKYVQRKDITADEYNLLYNQLAQLSKTYSEIIKKREKQSNPEAAKADGQTVDIQAVEVVAEGDGPEIAVVSEEEIITDPVTPDEEPQPENK